MSARVLVALAADDIARPYAFLGLEGRSWLDDARALLPYLRAGVIVRAVGDGATVWSYAHRTAGEEGEG